MSGWPRRRFNASGEFRKIRLESDGTEQHNCDAIFRQIGLFGFMIFEVPFNRDEVALIIDRSARLPGNPSRRE
jgi:hypothetical protein